MSLGSLAALISIAGHMSYIRGITTGMVLPERASWGIWTVLLLVAFWSSQASGAGDSLWFIGGELVACTAIFLLSLWRGVGGITRLDLCCMAIAVVGVVAWQATNLAVLAIVAVIVADGAGAVPTLLKSLRSPHSERALAYFASATAGGLGFLAVGHWDWALLTYPFYIFLVNLVTAMTVRVGQYHHSRETR